MDETKFERNWKSKSLEVLEKEIWKEPTYNSYLVITCHKLRKKPLKDFEIEDYRIMIGQNIGLKYLIPLAIEILEKDILAEGDLYEGDFLQSVLASDENYWKLVPGKWQAVKEIFLKNRMQLKNSDTIKDIKDEWFQAFSKFEQIN